MAIENGIQILIPKTVFVGEKVQLQYVFENESLNLSNDGNFSYETAKTIFAPYEKFLTIEDASLTHNGATHSLYLTFYVWEQGRIQFSPFKIGPAEILLEPIEVKSIVSEVGADGLKPFMSPLLIPGTTWMIYLGAVLGLVFLIGLVVVLKKINAVNAFFEKFFTRLFYRQNSKKTMRLLKKLSKFQGGDKDFCCSLQSIVRKFVEKRFKSNFSAVVSREIYAFFEGILGGSFSPRQFETIEEIIELFNRLDFVRFGGAGAGVLDLGEREKLILKGLKIVEGFENDPV